jgi:putative heme iron utilization protein
LTPTGGSFVTGFGQAFELTGEQLDRLTHVDEAAVRRRASARADP